MEYSQHNQHNQQNETPKDYSLLRKFDLEAAKRGELMCNGYGNGQLKLEAIVKNINNDTFGVIVEGGSECYPLWNPTYLRMLPLCWIEGKPVYKGDVLWRVDNRTGNLQKFVVESIDYYSTYSCNYLVSEDNLHVGLDFVYSTLHWEKPKVKVLKEGWMNIYPSNEYSTWSCESSAVYRTKVIADDCANSNRIDCVKVQWEVQE